MSTKNGSAKGDAPTTNGSIKGEPTTNGVKAASKTSSNKQNGSMAQAPERPPPPIVGKVTHHSIALEWVDALAAAQKKSKTRMKICVQESDKIGAWGNVYTGFAKQYVFDGQEKKTTHTFRVRFMNTEGNSEWSPSVSVKTTDEPITGEHIHKAVASGNTKELETILSGRRGDHMKQIIDTTDKTCMSPLMNAAKTGKLDIMDVLIKNGANVNFQNDDKKTPLMFAAFAGERDAVKNLHANGSRLDLQDNAGSSALHWGVMCTNTNQIEDLIDLGCKVTATDHNGWTPLHRTAAVGGNANAARILINRCPEIIDMPDKDKKTPLMMAVINGHMDLVSLLLDKGADISVKNEYGKNAYDMAVSMEKRRVIKVLEEHMDKVGIKRYT